VINLNEWEFEIGHVGKSKLKNECQTAAACGIENAAACGMENAAACSIENAAAYVNLENAAACGIKKQDSNCCCL